MWSLEAMGCSTSCSPFFLPKSGEGYPLEGGFLTSSFYLRTVVGFLGYNHDRQLALQALAVSAARSDVHAVFAGCVFSVLILLWWGTFLEFKSDTFLSVVDSRLVLMTYYGVILLMTGYQADEEHIVRQYKGIVNKCVISLVIIYVIILFNAF